MSGEFWLQPDMKFGAPVHSKEEFDAQYEKALYERRHEDWGVVDMVSTPTEYLRYEKAAKEQGYDYLGKNTELVHEKVYQSRRRSQRLANKKK